MVHTGDINGEGFFCFGIRLWNTFSGFFPKMRLLSIKVQVGEGGSLLGDEVVGHMVNEHLAEQLGEVYRSIIYPS